MTVGDIIPLLMSIDRVELRQLPKIITPESLEWEDFASRYLGDVDPNFHGDIEFAFRITKQAQANHPPRETGEPFFAHSLMTVIYLAEAGCTHPPHFMAGFLHDVPEDNFSYILNAQRRLVRAYEESRTYVLYEIYEQGLLGRHFGAETAEIVRALTKGRATPITERGRERFERDYQRQVRAGPPGSWVVKAADRLHNIRTLPNSNTDRIRRKIAETRIGYLPIFKMGARSFPIEGTVLLREIQWELERLESLTK